MDHTESKHIPKGPCLGMRHIQAALLFLNFAVLYINRIHVAITLVAMTNAEKSNTNFSEYKWNEQQKSYILSSFYWGYALNHFPGALFARFFGVKVSLLVFTMGVGLLTLLVPFCIPWGGWQVFCLLRFLQGVFQGGFYPAHLQHLAKWSPPAERNVLAGITHTGFECGTVTAMALSGVIAISSLGWPGIFYTYAAFCFLWCAIWQWLGSNDATKSSLISNEERLYIEDSLKNSVNFEEKRLPIPWGAIFTSKHFYALLIVRATSLAGIVTIQAELPSYMNGVLKIKLESNAVFSALPFLMSWFLSYVLTFVAILIGKRNLMSVTVIRKCFNSIGLWIPAIGIILIGFFDETHKLVAIVTMILALAFYSSTNMGSVVTPIDMAPNHAEILSSIINTISNCLALLGPLFFGIIVDNEQNRGQWQIAFTSIAAMLCIGDVVFLVWGTADEQPWNAADYNAAKTKNQSNELTETTF